MFASSRALASNRACRPRTTAFSTCSLARRVSASRRGRSAPPMGAGETERGDPATGDSVLTLANDGPGPMRLLLYAGERQGVPLVSYGPFIRDTRDDIVRCFERYKTGTFQRY